MRITDVTISACVDPPHIGNGYIISASPYNDGDVLVYTCQESYNMEGKADGVSCSNGKWVGEQPICTTNESKTLCKSNNDSTLFPLIYLSTLRFFLLNVRVKFMIICT